MRTKNNKNCNSYKPILLILPVFFLTLILIKTPFYINNIYILSKQCIVTILLWKKKELKWYGSVKEKQNSHLTPAASFILTTLYGGGSYFWLGITLF